MYGRTGPDPGETAGVEPNWSWKPHLKAMTVGGIVVGYVSLILSLFGVWSSLT